MGKTRRKRPTPERVLALPDPEQSEAALDRFRLIAACTMQHSLMKFSRPDLPILQQAKAEYAKLP